MRPDGARATYILPIRRSTPPDCAETSELCEYLSGIAKRCEVIVVDGSDPPQFRQLHGALSDIGLHVPPADEIRGRNGKVRGVLTGVRLATSDRLVIADDDVRYDRNALERVIAALDDAEVVRPQNVFASLPWHARWDTARSLCNRAFGADFPGTLAVRQDALEGTGGYDADVLFENLELIRTIETAGGREHHMPDCYVWRLPPTAAHFWSQRTRQAYDEFARPWRLAFFLSLIPAWLVLAVRRSMAIRALVTSAVGVIAVAEIGRHKSRGARVFPPSTSWFAPLWLLERACCSWLALAARLRGGCRYGDGRLVLAATPRRVLRERRTPRADDHTRTCRCSREDRE